MKDYKAKVKKIIKLYLSDLNNIVPQSPARESRIGMLESELSVLESQEVEGVSSDDIIKEAYKRHPDDEEVINLKR